MLDSAKKRLGSLTFQSEQLKQRISVYFCDLCSFNCQTKTTINKHLNKEHVNIKCHLCKKVFSFHYEYTNHLAKHKKSLNNLKAKVCKHCNLEFDDLKLYQSHIKIHKYEPQLCFICGELCKDHHFYLGHMKRHRLGKIIAERKGRKVVCQYCGESISTCNIEDHNRIHTGERPFKCTVCQKYFRTKKYLWKHMPIHTKEKRYKCKECGKCFTQWCGLNFHMRTHTNEKPFQCHLCQKDFAYKSSLTSHMKTHEEIETRKRDKKPKKEN